MSRLLNLYLASIAASRHFVFNSDKQTHATELQILKSTLYFLSALAVSATSTDFPSPLLADRPSEDEDGFPGLTGRGRSITRETRRGGWKQSVLPRVRRQVQVRWCFAEANPAIDTEALLFPALWQKVRLCVQDHPSAGMKSHKTHRGALFLRHQMRQTRSTVCVCVCLCERRPRTKLQVILQVNGAFTLRRARPDGINKVIIFGFSVSPNTDRDSFCAAHFHKRELLRRSSHWKSVWRLPSKQRKSPRRRGGQSKRFFARGNKIMRLRHTLAHVLVRLIPINRS